MKDEKSSIYESMQFEYFICFGQQDRRIYSDFRNANQQVNARSRMRTEAQLLGKVV
jgi:hypothetical protein